MPTSRFKKRHNCPNHTQKVEDDKLRFTLLQKADLDINALETTCAHFAAAEKTVDKFKGAKMEVAWSGVRSIEIESIAAVRGGMRQSRRHKDTQCYKCHELSVHPENEMY